MMKDNKLVVFQDKKIRRLLIYFYKESEKDNIGSKDIK